MTDTSECPSGDGPAGGVTPHLCVADAAAAIDFYARAFGAVMLGLPNTDPYI